MEKPGYAIITEGFHELSVDCMNTSFSLVRDKDIKKAIPTNSLIKKTKAFRCFLRNKGGNIFNSW
jgi:hypothetical protein